jgi:hypothetical protein
VTTVDALEAELSKLCARVRAQGSPEQLETLERELAAHVRALSANSPHQVSEELMRRVLGSLRGEPGGDTQ